MKISFLQCVINLYIYINNTEAEKDTYELRDPQIKQIVHS